MKIFTKLSLTLKIYIALCINCGVCEQVIYSITADVGAGNITHYSLKQEGVITLILDSIIGDADIYVSERNPKPDYNDYDLQSATFGQDVVTIPKDFNRPIGIGIFGHVYAPLSKYQLIVVLDYDASVSNEDRGSYANYIHADEESNPSTIWVIFVYILKIIVEILA